MSKAATDTLEKVASEFEAEVLADLEEGHREAMSKISAAKKDTAEEVAKILETGEKQSESVRRQIIGAAELDSRNAQLRSLEKAVTDVFESAVKEISGMSGAAYEKSMARLIEEGMGVIGPKAKVHCSSKDRKSVAAAIKKAEGSQGKLSLEEEPIETIGGIVLSNADGTVKFDNTFEARLERMRPTLRKDVADLLTASS